MAKVEWNQGKGLYVSFIRFLALFCSKVGVEDDDGEAILRFWHL